MKPTYNIEEVEEELRALARTRSYTKGMNKADIEMFSIRELVGLISTKLQQAHSAGVEEGRTAGVREERERVLDALGTEEEASAKVHAVYQAEAKRQGDVRHKDSYAELPENIKEFDRVLVRFFFSLLQSSGEGNETKI